MEKKKKVSKGIFNITLYFPCERKLLWKVPGNIGEGGEKIIKINGYID